MEIQRLIIDTDAGIDDAIALMIALSRPDVHVLGISTVTGNVAVDQVTNNVLKILDHMRKDILVYKGAPLPIVSKPIPVSDLMGVDGLGNAYDDLPFTGRTASSEPGALALIRLVHEAKTKGDFTLVALGPLTNLALAIRIDPTFARNVPRLVIMGGAMHAQGNITASAEFNFYADPEAATIVFEAGFSDLWVLPWETAVKYLHLWDDYEAMSNLGTANSEFYRMITAHISSILKEGMGLPGMPLPDPLAMAVALNPGAATKTDHVPVSVEVTGEIGRGLMAIDWYRSVKSEPNAHVISEVDFKFVLKLLRDCMAHT
jgi:purine nucleosidase